MDQNTMTPQNKLPSIPLEFSVNVDGRTWNLYSIEFDSADGKFETHLYALSFEHAELMLAELKATARVSGQCMEAYSA
jgi:hypothetical protein